VKLFSFARDSSRDALRSPGRVKALGHFLLQKPQIILTLALIVLMGILNPRFLTVRNLLNVLRQSSINGIVTTGVCWIMISGSFDLSVGALVSLISVTMVAMLERGSGIAETCMYGLGIGLGAVKAIAEAGLTDSIKVLGVDGGAREVYDAICDGAMWGTVLNDASFIAVKIIQSARDLAESRPVLFWQTSPAVLITKDNVDNFHALW
jgi:predicted ABC-type sugar transport system permease subunit